LKDLKNKVTEVEVADVVAGVVETTVETVAVAVVAEIETLVEAVVGIITVDVTNTKLPSAFGISVLMPLTLTKGISSLGRYSANQIS
jgi:hypothetical protein